MRERQLVDKPCLAVAATGNQRESPEVVASCSPPTVAHLTPGRQLSKKGFRMFTSGLCVAKWKSTVQAAEPSWILCSEVQIPGHGLQTGVGYGHDVI